MSPSMKGQTWWGRRWIGVLQAQSGEWAGRLGRGRGYAGAGRVVDLQLSRGRVEARVSGSRARPYRVTFEMSPFTDVEWDRAFAALAARAAVTVQLLRGNIPGDVEELLASAGLSLFPGPAELTTDCSCPDWANPCKHVAAVHYILGEALDRDPFLLFELRGRNRAELLSGLQAERARETEEAGEPATLTPADSANEGADPGGRGGEDDAHSFDEVHPGTFWEGAGPIPEMHFVIEEPEMPMAVLRQLGPPPGWGREGLFLQAFSPLYEDAGELAVEISQAVETPDPGAAGEDARPAYEAAPAPPSREPEIRRQGGAVPIAAPVPKLFQACRALLSIAAESGYVQPADEEQLSGSDRRFFRPALEALVAEGVLERVGRGRGARYVLVEQGEDAQ